MSDPKKDAVTALRKEVEIGDGLVDMSLEEARAILDHIATLEAEVADHERKMQEAYGVATLLARVAELEAEVADLHKTVKWEVDARVRECARVSELEEALREYNEWWADMGPKHPVHEKARALLNREDT